MVAAARKNNPGGRRQTTQARSTRGNGVAAGTVNYPGAAAHTGSCRTGFRAVEHSDFLGSTPVALNIYYNAGWQAIETRTNGTAASNVTSQMIWSAAYINAAILQDTYSAGVIQPNSRLYYLQDANWDTTAVVGFNSTTGTWGVTQRYVYSPYGNITVLNADWTTPPAGTQPVVNNLYQGMTLDAVTGLSYERFRNYSPSLGTWISQDPLSYVNGANTYQFVEGGPVGMVDPLGTVGVGIIGTGSAAGGVVVGAGATGSLGTGVFVGGGGTSVGGFASGGAAVGGPGISVGVPGGTGQPSVFGGAFAGVGAGGFLTNAANVSQLSGPFWQWNLDLDVGSVSLEYGGGVWLFSLTFGPGAGAAGTAYSTTTVTTASPPPPPTPPDQPVPECVPAGPSLGFW